MEQVVEADESLTHEHVFVSALEYATNHSHMSGIESLEFSSAFFRWCRG